MIISGLVNYFKSLSVGGSIVNLFTGSRKKVRLFYADEDILSEARSLELDATTEFMMTLDTQLMKVPAEDQVVYTHGALLKPKRIDIKAHIDVVKLEQINEMWANLVPVWVMCSKNMPGVLIQADYWSSGTTKFAISSITLLDSGYDNTVAVNISLEEVRLFSYRSLLMYTLKTNKASVKSKINKVSGNNGTLAVETPIWKDALTPDDYIGSTPN